MRLKILAVAILTALGAASPAYALLFDQNITPHVIFATGIPSGGWTVDRANGVELGLRARLRSQPTVNSNGDGTYSFTPGLTSGNMALWNYDFAVNVNFDGLSNPNLSLGLVDILLSVDTNPGLGTSFVTFDIFGVKNGGNGLGFTDNAVGNNGTPIGGGTPTNNRNTIGPAIVAQNSENLASGNPPFTPPFDANAAGIYDFQLTATKSGDSAVLATTKMRVIVKAAAISAQASMGLFLFGLAALVGLQWRRHRVA